ncbi:MAG: YrdB family protein [Anaerolineales bacterium]|nr:YrdB family protein [Anaerolineales bacterium]
MEMLKFLNSALAFFLELAMLIAFGYWGFHGERSVWLKWLLGIGIPVLTAVIWGYFFAPNSAHRLNMIAGALLSSLLFLIAAAALYQIGHTVLVLTMTVIVIINRVLMLIWKQW